MKEKLFGPSHIDVAATLNNLAVLYKSKGAWNRAAELYRKALSIFDSALSPSHPTLVACRKKLRAADGPRDAFELLEELIDRRPAFDVFEQRGKR